MLRKSLRLQEAGYYTEEGTPFISYREILYRIFRRKKGCSHPIMNAINYYDSLDQHDSDDDYEDAAYSQESPRIISDNKDKLDTSALTIEVEATQNWTPNTLTTGNQATNTCTTRTQATQMLTTGTQATLTATGTQTKRNKARTSSSSCVNIISGFLLLLLLASGFTHMHMQMIEIQQEMQLLRQWMNTFAPLADTTPNFALESQGARVKHYLSSDSYWPQEDVGIIWDRIFYWWYSAKAQRHVIQGYSSLKPGKCWSFAGERGHLFISLSHPISITNVTLGHITKSQCPHGYIASAPREFSIYGMRNTDEEGTHLGKQVYDQDGEAFQTFALPNPDIGVFSHVKLQIENNWGNIDHTCVYSFRVHGKLRT